MRNLERPGRFAMLLMLLVFMEGCLHAPDGRKKAGEEASALKLPEIPVILTTQEERTSYLTTHYWDHFNFADTVQFNQPEKLELFFVDFVQALSYLPTDKAVDAIKGMMERVLAADPRIGRTFMGWCEKYFYNPNSPVRNEELYIPVLQLIVSSSRIGELDKTRPRYQLEMALKNRPGSVAADFTYIQDCGKKGKLSGVRAAYILLFFNNPDCNDCRRVKQYLMLSEVFRALPVEKLKVLALYPDEEPELWQKEKYPSQWLNAWDQGVILREQLYDLKAIPCLYLLDWEKKVVMKDAAIEDVESFFKDRKIN